MKVLQPIEWKDKDGNTVRGIVTEDLGGNQGVVARAVTDPGNGVLVKEPHKIRDMEVMAAVWKALGISPKVVSNAGFIPKPIVIKPNPPKAVVKTPAELQSAFDKAMQEIDDMFSPIASKGFRDKLFLNSMGFNFVEGALPEPEKD